MIECASLEEVNQHEHQDRRGKRIAQEEQRPYFLLWGRRESMRTKPVGAKQDEGMYSWTWEILQNQIAMTLRNVQPLEIPERYKRPRPDSDT